MQYGMIWLREAEAILAMRLGSRGGHFGEPKQSAEYALASGALRLTEAILATTLVNGSPDNSNDVV